MLPFEIKREQKKVDEIKWSKYALGKNPENLTKSQQERLELIQAEDPQIRRGHDLKEKLRLILKLKDPELAPDNAVLFFNRNSVARANGSEARKIRAKRTYAAEIHPQSCTKGHKTVRPQWLDELEVG